MGVKVIISKTDLPKKYQNYPLIPTKDGISQTVYLLGKKFVIKIFDETYPKNYIDNEIEIYKTLHNHDLPIPKVVDTVNIKDYQAIIYTQIDGVSPKEPTTKDIESIGEFLNRLHSIKFRVDRDMFCRENLMKSLKDNRVDGIASLLNKVECYPNSDTLIHGDLFPDNTKFVNGELKGVFDFSEASMGDRYFDLAVVAISWCKKSHKNDTLNGKMIEMLCSSYGIKNSKHLKEYIEYALLFYTTSRYLKGKNYQELLILYDNLKEKEW